MIPTDPIGAVLWGVNLAIEALGVQDAYNRIKDGIAARAEKEGRDTTPEEDAVIDAMLEQSKKNRDGG